MKPFENKSHLGNEKAIRRGRHVPEGDVNLAYVKSPELSPEDNIVIVDTSRVVEENASTTSSGCKVYYANQLGILVDKNDNSVVPEEFPKVSDVFSEVKSTGSDYEDHEILAYRHVSQHLHLDLTGLAFPGEEIDYESDQIKVIDSRGIEYPHYHIKLIAAYIPSATPSVGTSGDLWAYRVHAYVDTDKNEDLYLKYYKTEIDDDTAELNEREREYKEILNPEPFFEYVPEESDVVDMVNRRQRIYSTKPISQKEQILGKTNSTKDGFRVYVPKKAVGDPRIYQIFRWRIKCTFHQNTRLDPATDDRVLKCGVLVTNKDLGRKAPSVGPYAFVNLARSRFNVTDIRFQNPREEDHSPSAQERRDYWFVNLDDESLDDYDLLIWSPSNENYDYSKYAPKVNDFVRRVGGTVFIDTGGLVDAKGTLGGSISAPVHPVTGERRTNSNTGYQAVRSNNFNFLNTDHPLLDGSDELGGWKIDESQLQVKAVSHINFGKNGFTHSFITTPNGYTPLVEAPRRNSSLGKADTIVVKQLGEGNKILSTMGVPFTCSARFDPVTNKFIRHNMYASSLPTSGNYKEAINGAGIEGAMKLLFNAALLAVKGRSVDNSDESIYSTNWSVYTPWRVSWAIDGSVLTQEERNTNQFSLEYRNELEGDFETVYKRKLARRNVKRLIDEANAELFKNPVVSKRIKNSIRTYEIEVTNDLVEVLNPIAETDQPLAWTEAHTPEFIVPEEIGAYVIKEARDEDGKLGQAVEFEDNSYQQTEYPELPYAGHVRTSYVESEELYDSNTVTVTIKGTYTGWKNVRVIQQEASTTTSTSNIELSWRESHAKGNNNRGGPIDPSGNMWRRSSDYPDYRMIKPNGIRSWQDDNYYTSGWGAGHRCWPTYGINTRLVIGSSGQYVKFAQEALNRFNKAGFFNNSQGKLAVDGAYGPKTSRAIKDFQRKMRHIYIDGVIDSETWYSIGAQINRLSAEGHHVPNTNTGYRRWFRKAAFIRPHRISDGNNNTQWMKRSWISNGPSTIWELLAITFDQKYRWHAVSLVPQLQGQTNTMMWRSIHITNERSLNDYNSRWGQLRYMNHRPKSGSKKTIKLGPYRGDTIIVGIAQDRPSGYGTSRMLGVKDITGHTKVKTVEYQPEISTIEEQPTENLEFTVIKKVSVEAFKDKVFYADAPKSISDGYVRVSDIEFTSVTVDNPEVIASMTSGGKVTLRSQSVDLDVSGDLVKTGPALGKNHRTMTINQILNPGTESGLVSRDDGIKLVCTDKKRPYGFPALPTNVGANEYQRHYAKLSIDSTGTSPNVQLGFYDINEKEFVTSHDGKPEISYIEYKNRGPQNIYVAVVTDFEVMKDTAYPEDTDAPRLPFKWAMPVYGVCTEGGPKITLEPLPSRLGAKDVWPISVSPGRFQRRVEIPRRSYRKISGYLSGYQGFVLEAFYDIPEADLGGYSKNHGRPNFDVTNEEPIILDDDVLQVRQAPLLMATFPTAYPTPADPVRPVITLYKRDSVNDAWEEWVIDDDSATPGFAEKNIKDVNASTGEIFLKEPVTSSDPALLRVDYTTKSGNYYFKKDGDQYLNLNAYTDMGQELFGDAFHVYMVPHYVKDEHGQVIADSVTDRTLRVTTSGSKFSVSSPDYDPLAVHLGVVYQSTALDLDEVVVLDTRRRGGGLRAERNRQELERLMWDAGRAARGSYQKAGFVIVRLPRALEQDFPNESQIREVIDRNIGAGIAYKIEDLDGKEW